jgi:hypothetical protein
MGPPLGDAEITHMGGWEYSCVVEHSPSIHEALCLTPAPQKTN